MKFVGLIMAFFIIVVMGFLTLGFIGTQSAPDPINNTVAYNLYTNQTEVVELSYSGLSGAMLLMIIAIVMAAAWMIIKSIS